MPQLRKDPVTKRWVIVINENPKGPRDFLSPKIEEMVDSCPFCPGNENQTSPEILSYRELNSLPNQPGWRLRVIANRYPALQSEGDLDRIGLGIYDMMNGVGAH